MSEHSIRRIEFLKHLAGASKYLEVGVNQGATFNNLYFREKVAVDPTFRFNTVEFEAEGIEFHHKTSDNFFAGLNTDQRFDIVFLDGLHTYEQTFRDFINSLQFCHSKSFILIDDTLPSDVFSAMRSAQFCQASRRQAFPHVKEISTAWHGDTYKVLNFIKMFSSRHDYATITDNGNPQTLVWNKAITSTCPMAPPFKRYTDTRLLRFVMEDLSRYDYAWAMDNFSDIFQTTTEDKLFEYLLNALTLRD